MKIRELFDILNQIAPFALQEEFDNSGVQFADLEDDISNILLCLDVTAEIMQEADQKKCNTILSHHPLLFHPLSRVTRQENPLAYQLMVHSINLIALHTNFDLAENGLNDYVGQLLGFKKEAPLKTSSEKIFKLAVYVPVQHLNPLQEALFQSGAGQIGQYSETSFSIFGKGSFKPLEGTKPFIGQTGQREQVQEVKLETIFLERNLAQIMRTIHQNHPYEEPVYDIYELVAPSLTGIGMVASLVKNEKLENFGKTVKKALQIPYLRIVHANQREINKIALCTGSGGSLLDQCINKQVDLLVTGDIDYHEALKAKEMGLNIFDIEHFHTEKFFVPAIQKQLIQHHVPEKMLVPSQKMCSPFQLF